MGRDIGPRHETCDDSGMCLSGNTPLPPTPIAVESQSDSVLWVTHHNRRSID